MKNEKVVDKPTNRRYSSVVKMLRGEGLPDYFIRMVKNLIRKDRKNLTVVVEDGKVFLVDKKTKEKV